MRHTNTTNSHTGDRQPGGVAHQTRTVRIGDGETPEINMNTSTHRPLTDGEIRTLARQLTDGKPTTVTYGPLADFINRGPDLDIDPRAIKVARDRLTAAAERGNQTAVRLLAQVNR